MRAYPKIFFNRRARLIPQRHQPFAPALRSLAQTAAEGGVKPLAAGLAGAAILIMTRALGLGAVGSTSIDDEVISSSLADIDAGAERDRAEQLVRDRLRREKLDDEPGSDLKVTRRLAGMLARRGYSQSMALDVVTVELAGERERRRV